MKKLIKPAFLKSGFLLSAMLFIQAFAFGSEKEPDIYLSRAPVTVHSGTELLHTPWFWALIAVILIVWTTALLSAKDKEDDTHKPVDPI